MFWGFANDIYTEAQGRRLFPMVGVGASVGALVGAESIRPLVTYLEFTPYTVMVTAAAVIMVALGVTYLVNQRETARADGHAAKSNQEPLSREGGFTLVVKDRYLTWIFLLMIVVNIVNSTGNYLLYTLVETYSDTIADLKARLGTYVSLFQGSFDALVSRVTLVLQLFATSRLIRWFGVGVTLHSAADRTGELLDHRLSPSSRSSGSENYSKTAATTRFRTRFGRRCSCRPAVKPSTKP